MGGTPPPFAENSAKIINLIFEPFPNLVSIVDHSWQPLHKQPNHQLPYYVGLSLAQLSPSLFLIQCKKEELILYCTLFIKIVISADNRISLTLLSCNLDQLPDYVLLYHQGEEGGVKAP